jgi:MinD-like ATPase involved in chromosome partitioning or flagellar assembly
VNEPVPVLLATGGLPGEADLVAALDRPEGGTVISRRCLDLADLLGAAATHRARAAVVDAGLRRLDADAVHRLQSAGLVVILLVGPDASPGLGALGTEVVELVGRDDGARVAAAVRSAARSHAGTDLSPSVDPTSMAPSPPLGSFVPTPTGRGRLMAVWGPHGAPGRTSVALTLADEAARRGLRTWLVDADTVAPSLGQRLGLLGDASGLVVAARLAGTGRLTPEDLARLAVSMPSGLRVLTGLPRPERWAEVRPAALRGVWELMLGMADLVVADVGAGIERDDEAVLDPGLPSRHGAAVTTLQCADRLVAVGGADPISLVRLARGLSLAAELTPGAVRDVVVNRVRRGGVGPGLQAQLREVTADLPAQATHFVPDEPVAWDTALFAGLTLAETAPQCAGRAVLAALLDRDFPQPARRKGRGRSLRHAAR